MKVIELCDVDSVMGGVAQRSDGRGCTDGPLDSLSNFPWDQEDFVRYVVN